MTVFHNFCRDYHEITAPPLDCARSGYLHTICSDETKEKISSVRLRLLSQQYLAKFSHRRDGPRCRLTNNTCSSCAGKPHQFHQRLQVSRFCKITPVPSGFHAVVRIWISCMVFELVSFDVATQHSRRSPSADCSHLKWKSQMVLLTTPSGSR